MQDRQDSFQADSPLERKQSDMAIPVDESAWREPSSAARWSEPTSAYAWTRWQRTKRPYYLPVKSKFLVSTLISTIWVAVSWYLAQSWIDDLSRVTGYFAAVLIIFFIALLPGFLNAHILSSVILDRPPDLPQLLDYPPISLLIAAYNEEQNITETFRGIATQDYPGTVEIIVVDDGSSDNTVGAIEALELVNVKIVRGKHGGKAMALNQGLEHVSHDILICIDADTFLHPQALRRIVTRFFDRSTGHRRGRRLRVGKKFSSKFHGAPARMGLLHRYRLGKTTAVALPRYAGGSRGVQRVSQQGGQGS